MSRSDLYAESPEMSALSHIIDHDHMQRILTEFSRLGEKCYLENAGATLYPQCLLHTINDDLLNNFYMNPHTDKYTKDCVEQVRCMVLKHFHTDPSTYTVVFTSGTTQALKLIVESFQFDCDENDESNCGAFMYLQDNHTSVLGLRELAVDKNADVVHISHDDFLSTVSCEYKQTGTEKRKMDGNTLLVYPAQSNFNGYKYPIHCIQDVKNGCFNNYVKKHLCKINCNWYVMLDAASYVSSNKLDLSRTQPDFVCLSFYKVFGYPTGLGALLIKNSSANVLNQKRYFGGGTVDVVLSGEDFHVKRSSLCERFEDGTLSFLSIIALKHCFDTMSKLMPKVVNDDVMETISYHTYYLARDLYNQLTKLHHRNGNKAAVLYMDSDFGDITKQGGTVTFNLLREDGTYIGYAEFQHMADLFNISVRTGCFCNSGSCQRHLRLTSKEMKDMYIAGRRCGDEMDLDNGRPIGAVRVSFGYFNTFNDVDKLITMICKCFVKTKYKKPKRIFSTFKAMKTPSPIKNRLTTNGSQNILNERMYFTKYDYSVKQTESKVLLKEIAIFPIKSCGAYKIRTAWKIGSKGFEYDREWMIIKDNGVCLTQKNNTRMCMIRPKIDLRHRIMILNFKGMPAVSVPLDYNQDKLTDASMCRTKVCTDTVQGYDCGDEVADWISEALEVSFLRLIRQSDSDHRVQRKTIGDDQKLLSLSNQAQYLLINKATVRWLKNKIEDPTFKDNVELLTDRFRGNLVIDMDEELAEREWQRIAIGKFEFKVEGQCSRCQMVCIDQRTGEKTVEPLRTISEQFSGKLRFGIYLSFVGTSDDSQDRTLKLYSPIKPIISDDDISR